MSDVRLGGNIHTSMTEENNSKEGNSQQLKSHVHGLLRSLAGPPSSIAPERTEDLKMLVKRHGIEILINDNSETSFEMGAMYGKIFTPMRVYHHLWSAALFFAALYIEKDAAAKQGKAEVDLDAPEIEMVWANYLLSCECFKENRVYPLPPSAKEITSRTDYIVLANELFLGMVAFCILHEIAHLEKGDSKTGDDGKLLNQTEPHETEFAADKWAYDWILARWSQSSTDPKAFVERTLGIIFSLAMMYEFRHHRGETFASSHPEACDRLIKFFQDYEGQINLNRWGATCLTATYTGLQVVAFSNNYLLPTAEYSDSISFLNIVKRDGPRLAAEAKARKAKYEAEQAKKGEKVSGI